VIDDAQRLVPQGKHAPTTIPPSVFTAAADAYLAGHRVDMVGLARAVGCSRATLYRHVGKRERLLDELIWWLTRNAFVDAIERTAHLRGVTRIAGVVGQMMAVISGDRALHAFLDAEPEVALRILIGPHSAVQLGCTGVLQRLIDFETDRGEFATTLETPELAYAIVRITEGFLYADIIADQTRDVGAATTLVAALLSGLDMAHEHLSRSTA
jgi:AcrR family transcriptional regulator